MNHLAHLLTAGDNHELRLGVLLGDHVRGRNAMQAYPAMIAAGIKLHRAVDSFTDQDQSLADLRNTFSSPYRRYVGIMLDVYFDHLLSLEWSAHCPQTLTDFNTSILQLLAANRERLPNGLERFRRYAEKTGVLARYGDVEILQQVFFGISQRLRHENPLAESLDVLQPRNADIDMAFKRFFPRLMTFAEDWKQQHLPSGSTQSRAISTKTGS